MSRFILIQEDDYERQYRESMAYLNSKYHDRPTKIIPMPVDDDGNDRYANGTPQVRNVKYIGKLVI